MHLEDMLEGVPDYLDVSFDVVDMYFQAAQAAFAQAQQLETIIRNRDGDLEHIRMGEAYDLGDEIDIDDWTEVNEAEQQMLEALGRFAQSVAITQVMCAFALEAHINFVARERLSGGEADAFDKLSVQGKWLLLPRLLAVPSFDSGAQPYQSFSALIKRRNALAHAKQFDMLRLMSTSASGNAFLDEGLRDASDALDVTRGIVSALSKALGTPEWILGAPTRFYSVKVDRDYGTESV